MVEYFASRQPDSTNELTWKWSTSCIIGFIIVMLASFSDFRDVGCQWDSDMTFEAIQPNVLLTGQLFGLAEAKGKC